MRITFSDFAAFVIMAMLVAGVFVAPYICALHWMYPPSNRPAYSPAPNIAPVKAGATSSHAHSSPVSIRESGLSRPGILRSTMGREQGGSEHGVRHVPCPSTNQFPFGCAETGRGLAFGDGAAWSRSGINRQAKDHGLGTYQGDGSEDTLKTCGRPISAKEWLNVERNQGTQNGISEFGSANRRTNASLAGIKPGHHLQTLAGAAAGLCGIDPTLFWSLILRESSGRHWDAQGRVLRSRSNALGLGQIKASTARGVAVHLDPMDPWDNAVASACYLRQMLDRYQGDIRRALHAYHRGPNARGATPRASLDYASDIMGSAQ